jgi:formate hydrogenlyase subunit 3/multisubunit Na+/H+ antiporter MnhD subunit
MPFALWLPAASDEAPNSAAVAGGVLGCATAAILAGVVGPGLLLPTDSVIHTLLGAGGGLAALGSSFLALGEKRPARMIAFLISANADLALAGLATGSPAATPSVVWLLTAQALSAAVTLGCLAQAEHVGSGRARTGWSTLSGLARVRPLLALALVVALLSLIGAPLTAGFVGRWNLATLAATNPIQSLAMLLASILGGAAIVRSFGTIFDLTDAQAEIRWTTDLAPALGAMLLVVGSLVPGQLLSILI